MCEEHPTPHAFCFPPSIVRWHFGRAECVIHKRSASAQTRTHHHVRSRPNVFSPSIGSVSFHSLVCFSLSHSSTRSPYASKEQNVMRNAKAVCLAMRKTQLSPVHPSVVDRDPPSSRGSTGSSTNQEAWSLKRFKIPIPASLGQHLA
jgi:hypothetical protein